MTINTEMQTRKGLASNGNVKLAYEVFGPDGGQPVLLLMGIGMQMLLWHEDFCRELVSRGCQVVRMDNRDVGLSTHLNELGEPSMFNMYFRPKRAPFYSFSDMAKDCVAVLDDLGWKKVNVVGGSMGGMIAQTLAIEYPERVRTLTSIMSSPSGKIGRARIPLAVKVGGLLGSPIHSAAEAGQQTINLFKIIGTPVENYPMDEQWLRSVGEESYRRAYDPAGKLRQQAALLGSADRRKALAKLKIPALIIHGDVDSMFRLAGGIATAKAIPDAKLVVLKGIGHGAFPRQVWPIMIDEICEVIERGSEA